MTYVFRYPGQRRLELFNETCTILWCHILVTFTDFVPDPERRYDMGFVLIFLVSFNMFVNLVILNLSAPMKLYDILKKWYKKKMEKVKRCLKKPQTQAPQQQV
jgi:hypothetical protein